MCGGVILMALGSRLVEHLAAGALCRRLSVRLKFSEMQMNAKEPAWSVTDRQR